MDVISNHTKLKKVDNEPEQYANKNENLGTNVSEKYVPELPSIYLKEDPLMVDSTYCSNIAQGHLKLNQYSECVKYSLLAQDNDKLNAKIYFRLAKGYFMLGKYDEALHILNEGIKINNDIALINLLQVVKRKKLIYLQKEKNTMKFIFQKLEEKSIMETDKKYAKTFFNNIFSFICLFLMCVYSLFVNLSKYFSQIIKKSKMIKNDE